MVELKKIWLVVYTKPRHEKKVSGLLTDKGIEAYCPLTRVRRTWSDRQKWVEEPLFKSYVFVHVDEEERGRIREMEGVVNFVYWLGKPAVVRGSEIETIRNFLNEYKDVVATPLDLHENDKVRISKGVLMDKEAKVIKIVNNRVKVVIESIGYTLVALVDRSNLVLDGRKQYI